MRTLNIGLAGFIVLLAPSVAFAQPAEDEDAQAKVASEGDVTTYSFEDDTVDGQILSPDGSNISSRGRVKHASLINIRAHFLPELINLALDI